MNKVNKNMLRSKMALLGDTYNSLANAMGISRIALYQKVNGNSSFSSKEINSIAKRYSLTNDEVVDIFSLGGE